VVCGVDSFFGRFEDLEEAVAALAVDVVADDDLEDAFRFSRPEWRTPSS